MGALSMYNPSMRTRISIVFLSVLFALLTVLPYLFANQLAGSGRFTGILFNPLDGASYLAKMRQGWEGSWLYTLAFTDAPGPGAFLFTYYLFLGHIARWFGLSLIVTYHAARVIGTMVFLLTAWESIGRLGLTLRARTIAWSTILVGSGFGWAFALTGIATSDLWIAEFIPFLGMLTSAHFPLAMALSLLLPVEIVAPGNRFTVFRYLGIVFAAGALAILQPFAILPLMLALAGWTAWSRWRLGRFPQDALVKLALVCAGAGPFALYDLWVVRTLPAFAAWAAQNQTPSPPVWDVALSFGPFGLIVGFFFVRWAFRKEPILMPENPRLFLIFWVFAMLLLMYLPISLQRRMTLGGFVPVAILAAPSLERWLCTPTLHMRRLLIGLLILPLSNLIVLAAMTRAIQTRDPNFFLSPGQSAAVDWLSIHATPGDVVLAPPELSRWIPGMTGLRVVYGHPMETPDADSVLKDVTRFYLHSPDAKEILNRYSVGWVYCTNNEYPCFLNTSISREPSWNEFDSQIMHIR
jgi:hypothetical protein